MQEHIEARKTVSWQSHCRCRGKIIEKEMRGKGEKHPQVGNRREKGKEKSIDHGKENVLSPALSFSVHRARNGKRGRLPNINKK